jgi:hypothetical protein
MKVEEEKELRMRGTSSRRRGGGGGEEDEGGGGIEILKVLIKHYFYSMTANGSLSPIKQEIS